MILANACTREKRSSSIALQEVKGHPRHSAALAEAVGLELAPRHQLGVVGPLSQPPLDVLG